MTAINRRNFLRLSGAGLAASVVAACGAATTGFSTSGSATGAPGISAGAVAAATPRPTLTGAAFSPDVEIGLTAAPDSVNIFSGQATKVWKLSGEVLQGDPGTLQPLTDTYLGPIMRLNKGQRVRIDFTNQLPQESIIHWHGMHVPAEMDGHPRYVVGNGGSYTYEFEVLNRAGTYWYHPHPHGRTGPQVYAGMAGFLLVSDEEERALELPDGEYDIPLVIQDRTFNSSNQLVYGGNGMMDQMMGFLGNQVLVNGQPDFTLSVSTRAYRLRLLNGSNSRIYKLAWDDGTPLTVIGNDGGLLEKPVQYPYVTMGPAERVELWVDFSDRPVGSKLVMQNWYVASSQGMMGGGRRSSSVQGGAFPIFTVSVDKQVNEPATLPSRLSTIKRIPESEAVTTRRVNLRMQPPGGWTLNGRTFEMTDVAPDEQVKLGTTEIWEFVNGGGMMGGMSLPHPIHMHGQQFQVLDRSVNSGGRRAWEAVKDGYVDGGWKDTVLVMPGERVRVLRRFADFTGLFLYHCHNLEHEDMGMMRNFEIVA